MNISERVFALAKQQKKTQSDIANALGIRQATVSAWKSKGVIPSSEHIAPLATFLGVSCDYLCTGRETPPPAIHQGVFGDRNHHNTVTIGGSITELSEFEQELISLCGKFTMRQKNALLTYAYKLEKGSED